MSQNKIVVTRHPALVEYLLEIGLIRSGQYDVIEHVDDQHPVAGRHVIGVLPLHLAVQCLSVTEVPLVLTREDRETMQRGDLTLQRLREVAQEPRTYSVQRLWTVREAVFDGATAASFNGEWDILEALQRPLPEGGDELGLLETVPRTRAELGEVYDDWCRPASHRGPQDPATQALGWFVGAAR